MKSLGSIEGHALPAERHSAANLQESLPQFHDGPGVYLMRDAYGEIIYVGKARNLKKRLSAYFGGSAKPDAKTNALIRKIADVETILTASEKEALILESNLIKRHRPRYNVTLKDDKRYPWLRLDLGHPYPRLVIVRKPQKDGARYFGPYASAHAVRQTLKLINRTFMLRKCTDREFNLRTRPCLHCQMQGCLAPCCRDVDRGLYEQMVQEVMLFLKGKTPELIRRVRQEMLAAAGQQDFEKAARLRDKMFALQRTVEQQAAVSTDLKDRDVVACARSADFSVVTLLTVRGGFLIGTRSFTFSATIADDGELTATFIRQFYPRTPSIPAEILTAAPLEDAALIAEDLGMMKGGRVRIRHPRRGGKTRLTAMALQNAQKELENQLLIHAGRSEMLLRLQKRLRLARYPDRIECFDNSNLAGTAPVSSMVVFRNGEPEKNAYRKYRVRAVSGPDDYATMAEVLERRFAKTESADDLPDLLILDGGKGQLHIALAVLAERELAGLFDVIGIAKKNPLKQEEADKIFKPGQANPIGFGKERDLLLFLQRIRDEAHRFALAYHRRRRGALALRSALDAIPGVGPARKDALLKHFRSVRRIREADVQDISTVPGISRRLAEEIKDRLNATVDS